MGKRTYLIGNLCIIACLIVLLKGRAMFPPYLITALFALFTAAKNRSLKPDKDKKRRYALYIISFIAAIFITLANYGIWLHPAMPEVRSSLFVRIVKLALILIIMSGTYFCAYNILLYIFTKTGELTFTPPSEDKRKKQLFFLVPFAVIFLIYMIIYVCCYFPGLLSLDSIDQVGQVLSGKYSNHQPFYHTMILGVFLRIGTSLFGSINAAVATYVVFQIFFMAFTFAFVIYNMAVLKLPTWCCTVAAVWYAVMPFHIMYSFTVWKDVYFGAFVTLMIIFFIRLMKGIGHTTASYAGFALCSLVMCLIRSNGLFAYVFVFLSVVLLARKQKKLILIMLATIVVAFVLKHSVLAALGVTQPDTVESLSIPLQQVARTVADNGYIDPEDAEFLSQIADLTAIADTYDPNISDPVKNMIRDYGNEDHLKENMGAFAKLYVRTFIHNPMSYVTAWVDSTCGYWNSGYSYWIWYWDIEDNAYGITKTVMSDNVHRFMDEYLWLYYNNDLLMLFTATGFFFWVVLFLTAICAATKNRTGIIAAVPILAIVLSLLVSTPVFAEFRYVYAMFCALPILIAVSTVEESSDTKEV